MLIRSDYAMFDFRWKSGRAKGEEGRWGRSVYTPVLPHQKVLFNQLDSEKKCINVELWANTSTHNDER